MKKRQTSLWSDAAEPLDKTLSRQEWVSACQFHEMTDEEVLRRVYQRVSESSHPVVLLDLDSTLYEVGPRTHQILQEWVSFNRAEHPLEIQNAVLQMKEEQVGYSISDIFSALNLAFHEPSVKKALESAQHFWFERFFTSAYLTYDRPYPGAAQFTRQLDQLGAEIVYLTGRDEPNMGDGTRANLVRDGFAWSGERTRLLMKSAFHLEDVAHKREAANSVQKYGTLVASFENEPHNLIALRDIFPEAMHVFMDTVCSLKTAQPSEGLYRISRFLEERSA